MTDKAGGRQGRRVLWTIVAAIGALLAIPFVIGVVHGFLGGEARAGLPFALGAGLLGAAAVVWLAVRRARREAERNPPAGPGEAAERARGRRFWTILGALFVVGMIVGMGMAAFETEPSGVLTGRLPAWFALAAAVATVAALTIGTAVFLRRVDEVEREDNIWASAVGANALLIVYPAWFLLWKGGWIAEPSHLVLILLTVTVMMAAYGYRKFR